METPATSSLILPACRTSSTCFALIARLKGGLTERSRRRPWNASPCPEPAAPGAYTPNQSIEHFQQLDELGIDQAVIGLPNVLDDRVFDLLGSEIVPAVKKLVPAGRTAGE